MKFEFSSDELIGVIHDLAEVEGLLCNLCHSVKLSGLCPNISKSIKNCKECPIGENFQRVKVIISIFEDKVKEMLRENEVS